MNSDNTADIVERPIATNRKCTICGATVAAWPKVMVCHCYEMPWVTDGPEAAAIITELRELVFESLYHLRTDARAEAYHNKANAALKDHRKAQAHD